MEMGRVGLFVSLAVLALSAGTEARAQNFSNFYVFGDSLSDAGTYYVPINGVLTSSKFTVNPYPVWDQLVGARHGIAVTPYLAINTVSGTSTVVGGNNYAQGGACVSSGFNPTLCPVDPSNTMGVTQQLAVYLGATGGRADSNALYSTWAGANNIFGEAILMAGGKSKADAIASVGQSANDQIGNIRALSQAGARYIIVPNLPDISLAPITGILGDKAFFYESVTTYNSTLMNGLRELGGTNIIYVDIFRMLNEVFASPAQFGFSNVTDRACTQLISLTCTTATLNAPGAQFDYLFADIVHPTPAGHALLAEYIESILEAPGLVGLLANTPIYAGWGIFRTLDSRLDAPDQIGWQLYSNVDYSGYDLDSSSGHPGSDGTSVGGSVGLEYGFGNGWGLGALLNLSSGNYDFSNNAGGFNADIFTATVYATLRTGGFHAQLSGTLGTISYDNVARQIQLGAATRVNSGNTNGSYYAARLATGYDLPVGDLTFGPIAQLSYQQVNVDGYVETQGNATSMAFGNQDNQLLFITGGGRAVYAFTLGEAQLKALVQASYNYNTLDNGRVVNAGLAGAPVTFDMPVSSLADGWTDLRVGLSAEAGKNVYANLLVGTQFLGDEGTGWYGNLGLTYRF